MREGRPLLSVSTLARKVVALKWMVQAQIQVPSLPQVKVLVSVMVQRVWLR